MEDASSLTDGLPQSSSPSLVSLERISKRFGDLLANDAVDLTIGPGEIHALLGENGAGKSTLVKILYGLIEPTEGEIRWKGEIVSLDGPMAARALGIGMVFQHFSLFDNLSVIENVAVALSPDLSLDTIARRIRDLGGTFDLALDLNRPVWTLSAGERQRIEIVRCLLQDPELLILDEPTSVLTPQEAEDLFGTLQRLAARGCAILYISHRLEEVRRLCHRATVLRAGRVVATLDPSSVSARHLAGLMVGAEIGDVKPAPAHDMSIERLVVTGLSLLSEEPHGIDLQDVGLSVRGGEIVGIAGVAGNGQSELFAALSGERLCDDRAILLDGEAIGHRDITARRDRGGAFVPEERLGHGSVPSHRLGENTLLSLHGADGFVTGGVVHAGLARRWAARIIKAFDVRKEGVDPRAETLSGGNLQKFVMGREILREPAVLVVNQPTWGVDAGAATTLRQALIDLAAKGSAVIVISQDLDELFEIADRIAVIHAGELTVAEPTSRLTREAIGLAMAGAREHAGAAAQAEGRGAAHKGATHAH
ncbi:MULTISPECIES: ABC transporter ATP-binding protein [unclassified Chelatococcus]|uniref:ABC transporter ATP-binding protein n=1 Tax=unclassified Chelatococcus TaxID=2638111 RepID=UPI001BCEFF27|nr:MULTISPECIES: ABC transporter ATP-binding protein [unclassified Chelatococcus]CAH1670367.1 Glucose import ATP-binding protein TsgD13 [Hyphomicrobiales bacterium]MBS7738330.1 ABC transporter ATP-binding protein [Chelatococcus sp. HY11]MBX3545858.1 ABC transporter ATP-binding protein [Chelatococcus sp.]MCO5077324.1 ABC transporter ATP-binding protein [Chelatococcus sp.]CAH1677400.1 Glucose import ATP-binding protein TsgD13 [Hyphomicrobiales bacterium]